jgi:hypothetical protein
MVSLPLLRFLLSIYLNRYVGAYLGAEGTPDAALRFFHPDNIVATLIILRRIGQHILGTESQTQPATLAPPLIDYYFSLGHVCPLFPSPSAPGAAISRKAAGFSV